VEIVINPDLSSQEESSLKRILRSQVSFLCWYKRKKSARAPRGRAKKNHWRGDRFFFLANITQRIPERRWQKSIVTIADMKVTLSPIQCWI